MQEEIRSDYNVPQEQVLEMLSTEIERGKHVEAEVACVAFRRSDRTDGAWTNGFVLVRVGCSSGLKAETHVYDTTILLREFMPAKDLVVWLERELPERLIVAETTVELQAQSDLYRVGHVGGVNSISELPGSLFRSTRASHSKPGHRALLHSDAPYFPNQNDAVRQWTACESFERGDSRWGELAVFVADNRARLSMLEYDSGELVAHVERREDFDEPLWIKAGHRIGNRWTSCDAAVSQNRAYLRVPADVDQFDLYLIGTGTEILDRHVEYPHDSIGLPGVVIRSRNSRGAGTIRQIIDRGEGETSEFKVFIDPNNTKAQEVLSTVIAFANTHGGKVLIGVSDSCEIKGIDRALEAATRAKNEPVERDQDWYVSVWRKKISHGISPDPSATVSVEKLDGRTLLVIDVPAGKDRPYIDPSSRKAFVRRGANTVAPDPRSDWADLLGNDPFRPGRASGLG